MTEVDPILAAVVAPAREQVERIEAEIASLETQIEAKREERRRYQRVLTAANGSKPGIKKGTRRGTKPADAPISADAIARIEAQIRKRYDAGQEFTGTDVYRDWIGDDRLSSQTVNIACRNLHAGGVLRLVKRGQGGSYIYRVVK